MLESLFELSWRSETVTLLKKRLWLRCFPVNLAKFLRTPFFYGTPLVAGSGLGGGLNWPFLKKEKSGLIFQKKSTLTFKKSALFVCMYRLNLKRSFKSVLEKRHQTFSLRSLSFVCRTWNVYWSTSITKNLPCPEKFLNKYIFRNYQRNHQFKEKGKIKYCCKLRGRWYY